MEDYAGGYYRNRGCSLSLSIRYLFISLLLSLCKKMGNFGADHGTDGGFFMGMIASVFSTLFFVGTSIFGTLAQRS